MKTALMIIVAYLLGSIPSGLWVGKIMYGKDISKMGSGNIGTTNAFRELGPKAGTIVLITDILKGTLAAAGVAALAACFAPVLVRCGLYGLAFRLAGILAEGCGQSRSGQICALYADGAQLCGSVLILYAFMVVLSTALLLISGNGG